MPFYFGLCRRPHFAPERFCRRRPLSQALPDEGSCGQNQNRTGILSLRPVFASETFSRPKHAGVLPHCAFIARFPIGFAGEFLPVWVLFYCLSTRFRGLAASRAPRLRRPGLRLCAVRHFHAADGVARDPQHQHGDGKQPCDCSRARCRLRGDEQKF